LSFGLYSVGALEAGVVQMTVFVWLQIGIYLIVLLLLVKPLGSYMARVFQGQKTFLSPIFAPVERLIYKILEVRPIEELGWKMYAVAILALTLFGLLMHSAYSRASSSDLFIDSKI
jgi:K+-transporting ATPase ATPase A chain